MSSLTANRVADGVLAATHKLVQQAMTGQWQEVPKTVQERRDLLNTLSASASPQDRQWLGALQQAMAESDAAVARMSSMSTSGASVNATATATVANASIDTPDSAAVDGFMELLKKSR